MGYVLEFWALDRTELVAGLRRSRLADQIAAGGAILAAEPAAELAESVRRNGFLTGSVDHSSGGGSWFHEQFESGGAVAAALGAETADHLLDRPIEGLTTELLPAFGWLTHSEVSAALTGEPALPGGEPDQAELAADVLSALRLVADRGQDLVTIYT